MSNPEGNDLRAKHGVTMLRIRMLVKETEYALQRNDSTAAAAALAGILNICDSAVITLLESNLQR